MEFVFTLLVVILLIVLPIALLLLVIGGLVYAVYRAIRGEKTEGAIPSPPGVPKEPAGAAEFVATRMSSSIGRKDV